MDEDTHLCLRCQQLVVGLKNYVSHRSRSCLPSAPPVVQSCWSQDATHHSEPGETFKSAPDFFLSLELQSAEPKATAVSDLGQDRETESEQSDDDLCQSEELKTSTNRTLLSQLDHNPPGGHTGGKWKPGYYQSEDELYQSRSNKWKADSRNDLSEDDMTVVKPFGDSQWRPQTRQDSLEDSVGQCQQSENGQRQELSEDDLFPPRSHTSGKWKPGTRPDLTNEVWLVRSASPDAEVGTSNYMDNVGSEELSPSKGANDCYVTNSRNKKPRSVVSLENLLCTRCELRFQNMTDLGIHLFSSSHISLVSSDESWLRDVQRFQSTFFTLLPFQCAICRFYFVQEKDLYSHFSERDHFKKLSRPIICLTCRQQLISQEDLLDHLASTTHKSARKRNHPVVFTKTAARIYCNFCGSKCKMLPKKSYSNRCAPDKLETSVKCSPSKQGGRTVQPTKPPTPKRYFNVRRCDNETRKTHLCDQCSFRTSTKSRLKRHVAIHTKARSRHFLCESCGLAFHDRATLIQHTKRHTKKTHQCPDCQMMFHTVAEMTDHRSRLHSDNRPHLCHICGYSSKSRQQLYRHQRRLHSSSRRACPHPGCQFVAVLSGELSRHLRVHSGIKPYKCPYCKYETGFQENLRSHILKTKKHRGRKVYPCKECRFATDDFGAFTSHVNNTHSHSQLEPTTPETVI